MRRPFRGGLLIGRLSNLILSQPLFVSFPHDWKLFLFILLNNAMRLHMDIVAVFTSDLGAAIPTNVSFLFRMPLLVHPQGVQALKVLAAPRALIVSLDNSRVLSLNVFLKKTLS